MENPISGKAVKEASVLNLNIKTVLIFPTVKSFTASVLSGAHQSFYMVNSEELGSKTSTATIKACSLTTKRSLNIFNEISHTIALRPVLSPHAVLM